MYSTGNVLLHLLDVERRMGLLVSQETFRTDSISTKYCSSKSCSHFTPVTKNIYGMASLYLDTKVDVICDHQKYSIQERIDQYMVDKIIRKCICGTGNITRSRKIISTPILLHISCTDILTDRVDPYIDPSITRMGYIYDLVGVGYGDGAHFTGSFFTSGGTYEYDGMKNGGLCRMSGDDSHFFFEPRKSNYSYKKVPNFLWYKRRN